MNSIFLFDIDGTLSKDGIIPESAKRTLKMLRENGNIVMLATGRCLGQMSDILNKIEVDGAILNNGSLAIINNEIVFESKIDENIILKMLYDGLDVATLAKDSFVRFKDGSIYNDFTNIFNINTPKLENLEFLDKNNVYSLGVYSYNPDSINLSLYPELRFIKVCDLGYDVINNNITKATAIEYIKNKYPRYNIVAFGDNYNDIEMLDSADISIVMVNAPNDVKKHATYVTRDVFDDGIEYAIKSYLRGYYEAN